MGTEWPPSTTPNDAAVSGHFVGDGDQFCFVCRGGDEQASSPRYGWRINPFFGGWYNPVGRKTNYLFGVEGQVPVHVCSERPSATDHEFDVLADECQPAMTSGPMVEIDK